MRTVYDTTGANVTATVKAYMLSNRTLLIYDLFWIQFGTPNAFVEAPTFINGYYTGAAFPISVGSVNTGANTVAAINATFKPARIERSSVRYETGMMANDLTLTWYIGDTDVQISSFAWGYKWAATVGYLSEASIRMYAAIFQQNASGGVGPLLGTTLMWYGLLRDFTAQRDQISIVSRSLLEVFKSTKYPTQLIQPQQRSPVYLPPATSSELFSWVPGIGHAGVPASTPTDFVIPVPGPPGVSNNFPDHSLKDSYMVLSNGSGVGIPFIAAPGAPAVQMYRILDNVNVGSGINKFCHIYPYQAINPPTLVGANGGTYGKVFRAQSLVSTLGAGFPYVPAPENGI